MAEKPNEEYPCDKTDNTDNTSEIATSSNNKTDENSDDSSGVICTTRPNPKKMPEIFFSFNELFPEYDAFQSFSSSSTMANIVSTFFDEIICEDKALNNQNHDKNYQHFIDINVHINNEPTYFSAKIIQHNMLVTFKTSVDSNPKTVSSIVYFYKNVPELLFSLDYLNYISPELPLSLTLTPPLNVDVNFVKQGQEYIDFMSVFTEFDFCKPFLEKIFSYLSYKDITSMTSVSKTWRKAVSNSVNAQKELEKVFIHAILYFCHKNANVTDEYKQLYDKILMNFKNQIQFKKHDFQNIKKLCNTQLE